MNISKNTLVKIDYTLKNEQGETLDSTNSRNPLEFLYGYGSIIPGLENALNGKQTGDSFSITIQPEDAYGQYNEELILNVAKENFQIKESLSVGMQVQGKTEFGYQVFTIKAINNDTITLDSNHPLAGKILYFDISIKDVRVATDEEIKKITSHTHVHDDSCNHE